MREVVRQLDARFLLCLRQHGSLSSQARRDTFRRCVCIVCMYSMYVSHLGAVRLVYRVWYRIAQVHCSLWYLPRAPPAVPRHVLLGGAVSHAPSYPLYVSAS